MQKNNPNYNFSLSDINGSEIIDFLNAQFDNGLDPFEDTNLCYKSFVFESQLIENNKYKLRFSVGYNNWGNKQIISGHSIIITQNDTWVSMDEPFDGDGSDDAIEKLLRSWLKEHTFTTNMGTLFNDCLAKTSNVLDDLKLNGGHRDDVIAKLVFCMEQLTKASTYVK